MKIGNKVFLILLSASIISCGGNGTGDYSEEEINENSTELNAYFEKEFQKEIEESPMMQTQMGMKTDYGKWDDFSNLKFAEDLEQARKRLEYLENVDKAALNAETELSYELFERQVKK